jgi:hypothetical protein
MYLVMNVITDFYSSKNSNGLCTDAALPTLADCNKMLHCLHLLLVSSLIFFMCTCLKSVLFVMLEQIFSSYLYFSFKLHVLVLH